MTIRKFTALLCCALALAGCSSFGKGVTKAIIEETKADPDKKTGLCEITGPGFSGLRDVYDSASAQAPKTIRLLIVHGIGQHLPGYSARFQRRLALRLGLTMVDPVEKDIALRGEAAAAKKGEALGNLRIARYTDAGGKELLTFEVTWSAITDAERKVLNFDRLTAAAKTRATLNGSLKLFMNEGFSDPLSYSGPKGALIRDSVVQSICWATSNEWADYPVTGDGHCTWSPKDLGIVARDAFVLSSHSLGSRITMDALDSLGALAEQKGAAPNATLATFHDKLLHFYMLSNQLPLLQIGRKPPSVVGLAPQYCGDGAAKGANRWFKGVDVVAFSDPNDLFSYEIPVEFANANLDSRICAGITNVAIKVAKEIDLAVSTFASPEAAHTQYEDDERVLDLMAGGVGGPEGKIPEGCDWLKFPTPEATEARAKP